MHLVEDGGVPDSGERGNGREKEERGLSCRGLQVSLGLGKMRETVRANRQRQQHDTIERGL